MPQQLPSLRQKRQQLIELRRRSKAILYSVVIVFVLLDLAAIAWLVWRQGLK